MSLRLLGRIGAWSLVAGVLGAQAHAAAQTQRLDMAPSTELRLSGDVTGLAPGVPGVLHVRLVNAADAAATVHTVRAAVSAPAGRADCAPELLQVDPHRGEVVVPAHSAVSVSLVVRFVDDLPAACAAVSWGLRYSAY